jgi:hypothetical protein
LEKPVKSDGSPAGFSLKSREAVPKLQFWNSLGCIKIIALKKITVDKK